MPRSRSALTHPSLLDRQQYRALPVHAHDVSLRGSHRVPSNIFDVNSGAANRLDRDSVQVRNRLRRCIGNRNMYSLDPIFEVPVGRMRFCRLIALTTSSATILCWQRQVSGSEYDWRCCR